LSLNNGKLTPLHLSLHYVTNFQPNCTPSFLKNSQTEIKRNLNSKVFCKNFLIFLIIIRNVLGGNNPKFFIKPNYSNTINILRAPYKNKISKHQVCLSRYFIVVKFKLSCDNFFCFNNLNSLVFFINQLKEFYSFFETNICFQHRSVLFFNFFYQDFFKLTNYS